MVGSAPVRSDDQREHGDSHHQSSQGDVEGPRFPGRPRRDGAHLNQHPFVSEVCIVGIPHEFHGELPFAFIVPEKKAAALVAKYPKEEAKLRDIIAKHVTDHKALPGGFEFVDSVPKVDSGKLLRRVARENAKKLLAEKAEQAAALKTVAA